jgi:heat shock protein HslJ
MQSRTLFTLAMASALLVGACTRSAGASAPPVGTDPPGTTARAGLEGRTFLATEAFGRVLVPESHVRLSFKDGQIGASGGCNSMGGPYAVEGGRLVVRQLAMTEMACGAALMDQDAWLASLLDGAAIRLEGDTLTLAKPAAGLTLVDREVADPDRPLVGTRWVVDGLVEGDAVASVPAGVVAALTFSAGRVDVEAGCNRGGGAVSVTDATLTFGPIALTKMACEGSAMEVERLVSEVLSGAVGYTIEAGTLTLDAGAVGLTLRAAP